MADVKIVHLPVTFIDPLNQGELTMRIMWPDVYTPALSAVATPEEMQELETPKDLSEFQKFSDWVPPNDNTPGFGEAFKHFVDNVD